MHSCLSILTSLALLLAACDPSAKTTTDTNSSTESPDAGTDAGSGIVIPGSEADAGVAEGPYPQCTLADAQETLDGLWSRNDVMDVWTEEDIALCNAKCEGQPDQNQCTIDQCAGGAEFFACVVGWQYYCASQPESGCSEDYRRFGCCVRANCAAADDEACLATVCNQPGRRMAACANSQCAATARDMCVR